MRIAVRATEEAIIRLLRAGHPLSGDVVDRDMETRLPVFQSVEAVPVKNFGIEGTGRIVVARGRKDVWFVDIKRRTDKVSADDGETFVEMRDKVNDPQFQFNKKIEALIEKEFPDLYRSRYGMITYTLIPYAVAQQAGIRQVQLLNTLAKGLTDPAQLDLSRVKEILKTDFYPWLKQQGFSTESYSI